MSQSSQHDHNSWEDYEQKRRAQMRWAILIILAICLFVSIGFSIVALIITHNLLTLGASGLSTPFLLAMRPIIRYLFPQEPKLIQRKKQVPRKRGKAP